MSFIDLLQSDGCDTYDSGSPIDKQQFVNTVGIMCESVVKNNKITGAGLVMSNIASNIVYAVLQIIVIITLIWYMATSILSAIKAKLDKIDWVFDHVTKIWIIVNTSVKSSIDAIKKVVDEIKKVIDVLKNWFDNFELGKLLGNLSKKVLGKLCFWC